MNTLPGFVLAIVLMIIAFLPIQANAQSLDANQQKAIMASRLFGIVHESIDDNNYGANYAYNSWKANPGMHKNGKCDAYQGGHSGIDFQTKDVAGEKTTNREFFSISRGKVIKAGGDKYNTIAIYDAFLDLTALYLHARRVNVVIGQEIAVGSQLGIQGSRGAGDAEHVHYEIREGEWTEYACGASDPTSLNPEKYSNYYLDESSTYILDPTPSVKEVHVNAKNNHIVVHDSSSLHKIEIDFTNWIAQINSETPPDSIVEDGFFHYKFKNQKWTTLKNVNAYIDYPEHVDLKNSLKPVKSVNKGEWLTLLEERLISKPIPCRVSNFLEKSNKSIEQGQTVLTYGYFGEGCSRTWYGGVISMECGLYHVSEDGCLRDEEQTTDWGRFRDKSGDEFWLEIKEEHLISKGQLNARVADEIYDHFSKNIPIDVTKENIGTLMAMGANINAKITSKHGLHPAYAILRSNDVGFLKHMMGIGFSIDENPLCLADIVGFQMKENEAVMLEFLLENGMPLDCMRSPPLIGMLRKGIATKNYSINQKVEIARLLINAGAKVNERDSKGKSIWDLLNNYEHMHDFTLLRKELKNHSLEPIADQKVNAAIESINNKYSSKSFDGCTDAYGPLTGPEIEALLLNTDVIYTTYSKHIPAVVSREKITSDKLCLEGPVKCYPIYYCASNEAEFFVKTYFGSPLKIISVKHMSFGSEITRLVDEYVYKEDKKIVSDPNTGCKLKTGWSEITSIRWDGKCVDNFIDGEGEIHWYKGKELVWITYVGKPGGMIIKDHRLAYYIDLSKYQFQLASCEQSGSAYRSVEIHAAGMDPKQFFSNTWVSRKILKIGAEYVNKYCPAAVKGWSNIAVRVYFNDGNKRYISARSDSEDKLNWSELSNRESVKIKSLVKKINATRVANERKVAAENKEAELKLEYQRESNDIEIRIKDFSIMGKAIVL